MGKVEKILPVSLNDLNFSEELLKNEVIFDFEKAYIIYFLNGVSIHCLAFNYNLSKYFKNQSNYRNFYKKLSDELNINISYVNNSSDLTKVNDDTFYIPENMTVIEFYECIRNCLAHRNFFSDNENRIIFFMSYTKYERHSTIIKNIYNNNLKFIFKCTNPNLIVEIGEFLYKFIRFNDNDSVK